MLLIAFDGIDSSGKETQTKQLAQRLRYQGHSVHELCTPDYTTATGRELKRLLQNQTEWAATPWTDRMKLFARNRAEHRPEVLAALAAGAIVVYDRYVPSSLAFFTVEALAPQEVELKRAAVQKLVAEHEYRENAMPRQDISVFLDVPPGLAGNLLSRRKKTVGDTDEYTDELSVQERLYNEYDVLTRSQPERFLRITCMNGTELLGIGDIAELVWQGLLLRFPVLATKKR